MNGADHNIREKQYKIENFHHDLSSSQVREFENTLKLKKLTEENKSLINVVDNYENERKELINKYATHNEKIQKVTL